MITSTNRFLYSTNHSFASFNCKHLNFIKFIYNDRFFVICIFRSRFLLRFIFVDRFSKRSLHLIASLYFRIVNIVQSFIRIMNFRDNIKIRVDKVVQQVEVKNIKQNVNQLNVDDDEIDEKFSKQQNSQIIKSKKFEIFCSDFFNVQVQEFINYINKNFMNAFNKTFDKRID